MHRSCARRARGLVKILSCLVLPNSSWHSKSFPLAAAVVGLAVHSYSATMPTFSQPSFQTYWKVHEFEISWTKDCIGRSNPVVAVDWQVSAQKSCWVSSPPAKVAETRAVAK